VSAGGGRVWRTRCAAEQALMRRWRDADGGSGGRMSDDDIERFEDERELELYRSTATCCRCSRTWWRRTALLPRQRGQARAQRRRLVEVTLEDAWVWDMFRPAGSCTGSRSSPGTDVNVEELDHATRHAEGDPLVPDPSCRRRRLAFRSDETVPSSFRPRGPRRRRRGRRRGSLRSRGFEVVAWQLAMRGRRDRRDRAARDFSSSARSRRVVERRSAAATSR
jgi:hypothetical protein